MKQAVGVLMTVTATHVRSIRKLGHVQKVLMMNVIIAATIPLSTVKPLAQKTDALLITDRVFLQTNIARIILQHSAQQIMTVQATRPV